MIRAIATIAILMTFACGGETVLQESAQAQLCTVAAGHTKADVRACLGDPVAMISGLNGGHTEEAWFYDPPAQGRLRRVNFTDDRVISTRP